MPPRWLRLSLTLIGLVLLIAGLGGIVLGLVAADWLRDRLTGITADASVVGGAAVALGSGIALLGAGHVTLAVALGRTDGGPSRAVRAAGVVIGLALAMAVVVGLAAVAVSLARETSAFGLLAVVPPLLLALAVYATLAVSLLRVERR